MDAETARMLGKMVRSALGGVGRPVSRDQLRSISGAEEWLRTIPESTLTMGERWLGDQVNRLALEDAIGGRPWLSDGKFSEEEFEEMGSVSPSRLEKLIVDGALESYFGENATGIFLEWGAWILYRHYRCDRPPTCCHFFGSDFGGGDYDHFRLFFGLRRARQRGGNFGQNLLEIESGAAFAETYVAEATDLRWLRSLEQLLDTMESLLANCTACSALAESKERELKRDGYC